jgi:hypothetical protein
MSVENVKKYFELLTIDEELVAKMMNAGEDKTAKMQIIKDYGMDFTREEFMEYVNESKRTFEESNQDIDSLIENLDEKMLEQVVGGGILTTPAAVMGALGATVACGGIGALVGLVCGGPVGAVALGGTAAVGGFSAGLSAIFASLFSIF